MQGDSFDGIIPQLFTSVPALNDAASYLAQTTSYFTRCFSDYSGNFDLFNSSMMWPIQHLICKFWVENFAVNHS